MPLRPVEADLVGRMLTVETLLMALMAHMADLTTNPAGFAAQVMDDAEQAISRAAQQAPQEMDQCAIAALESFGRLSAQMLAHLNRHASPQGRG